MPFNPESFLWWPVAIQTSLFCLFSVGLLLKAGWAPVKIRRLGARLDQARDRLFSFLTQPQASREEVLESLGHLPKSEQLALLSGLSRQLDGPEKARLEELADSLGLVSAAERACTSSLWWEQLQGVRTLLVLGAYSSIPVALVRDRHPVVRAEAVRRWTNTPIEGIPHLLLLLDDPTPVGRFAVQDALLRIGSPVAAPLGEYLSNPAQPGLVAAIEVAARLSDSSHLVPALVLSHHGQSEIRGSAAQLLGSLGGEESCVRLVQLLSDAEPEVRESALSALANIGEWSVAPQVAKSLDDAEWLVRKAAALALAHLGSAGKLYLLKFSTLDTPGAVMARYALSLPAEKLEARQ